MFLALVLDAGKALAVPTPGIVEMRFAALARLTYTEPATVREIVTAAHEIGLLADLEGDGERFTARLTRWESWEAKDRTGAQRQSDYRARRELTDRD